MIGFGNCGGFVATFTFLAKDGPRYHKGYSICMAVACVGALAASSYGILVMQKNRQLKKMGLTKEKGELYNL